MTSEYWWLVFVDFLGDEPYEVDTFLDASCSKLLECRSYSVFIANDGCYVLVSQIEFYFNDRNIDDCSYRLDPKKASKLLKFNVEKKGDSNRWVEAKIYVQDFEILITGGIAGYLIDEPYQFTPFLGASCPQMLEFKQYWLLYSPTNLIEESHNTGYRLLRNFAKASSFYQWSSSSQKSQALNFSGSSPFEITEDLPGILAGLIRLGEDIDDDAMDRSKEDLKSLKVWKELGDSGSVEEEIKQLEDIKMGVAKKKLVRYIIKKDKDYLKANAIDLFKVILYPVVTLINNKKAKAFQESMLKVDKW